MVATDPQASLQISVLSIPRNQKSIPVTPNTSGTYLYVILGTGCQRSVVGRHWLRGAGIELEARFGLKVTPYPQTMMVKFGPHPAELFEFSCSIPVGIAGVSLAW